MLREVKALANLQHANIVGYNSAWMESDSPYSSSQGENQFSQKDQSSLIS